MQKKLYIGNLPVTATAAYLENTFSACGQVESIKMSTEKATGYGQGFAFVVMSSSADAQSVISRFNGTDYDGKIMKISEVKPMQKRNNDNRTKKGW